MQNFTKAQKQKLKEVLQVGEQSTLYAERLWKKVEVYKRFLSYIPGISCICIANSLAMNACHAGSDIDLFVIAKKNRLWTARFFLTLFFIINGQRKTRHRHAGKFCLSFFITQETQSFENIAIQNDIYLAYWIETLVPIINKDSSFEIFLEKNNWYSFEDDIKPKLVSSPSKKYSQNSIGRTNIFGDIFENLLKKILLPKTQKSFESLSKPFGIIITDTMLKYHNDDQREIISQKVFLL